MPVRVKRDDSFPLHLISNSYLSLGFVSLKILKGFWGNIFKLRFVHHSVWQQIGHTLSF
jgi:hypothetical protein